MILVQIATALAIGIYVVLSKDVRHKCLDATPRESLRQRSAEHRTAKRRTVALDGARNPTPSIPNSIGTKHLNTTGAP
jgi:hypothetical protein